MLRLVALLILTAALTGAAQAAAKPLPGDPRTCVYKAWNVRGPAYCAVENARLAARRFVGGPGALYQGPSKCARVSQFSFTYTCLLGATKYQVKYAKKTVRWVVVVKKLSV